MLNWLEQTGTDVLCVQETKVDDEHFPLEQFTSAGYNVAFFGQKSYNGVAIISTHEIADVQKGFHDDDDEQPKRLIAATINGIGWLRSDGSVVSRCCARWPGSVSLDMVAALR